ncbi:unnamed protein product [Cuscuta campestris]|uniref:Uncharacterized protein n=1 Tax=Cuscuta campestris TaxID=132261 RepID=A0A484NC40_9ASTE|nr:unnamed protein product [Cuscuta campestris]
MCCSDFSLFRITRRQHQLYRRFPSKETPLKCLDCSHLDCGDGASDVVVFSFTFDCSELVWDDDPLMLQLL